MASSTSGLAVSAWVHLWTAPFLTFPALVGGGHVSDLFLRQV